MTKPINLTPPTALQSEVILQVFGAITAALHDCADPTLSENAKQIRADVAMAALRYYRAIVTVDAMVRLAESFMHEDNDLAMETLVTMLGDSANSQVSKYRDQLNNLVEGLLNDRPPPYTH